MKDSNAPNPFDGELPNNPPRAYEHERFLGSRDARALRILSEYLEPLSRFDHYAIEDTIVFMGSARLTSAENAATMKALVDTGEANAKDAERVERMSVYYEAARELAQIGRAHD